MQKPSGMRAFWAIALTALIFAACPTDSDDDEPSPGPTTSLYTVTFSVGAGSGTAPAKQTHESGTVITLPKQGEMIAPEDYTFEGWKTGDLVYEAEASFMVTKSTAFVAQWIIPIDPNKTYVEFNNLEQFPAIMYSDSSRQTELVRVPGNGKKLLETEPKPQGTVFYPRFLLEFEGIPLSYDGTAIMIRVDEKKINQANIPALTAIETGFAYIKIENASIYSLTFTQGNYELPPLAAASNIIMPGEAAAYQIAPGAASLYRAMKNGSILVEFPAQTFEAEMLYIFKYDGNALTLSSARTISQAIQGIPPAPAWITATPVGWNRIELTWAEVNGAASYKLYRQADGSGSFELVKELSGLTSIDTGLQPNSVYTYRVTALSNKGGEGPASSSVSAHNDEPLVTNAAEMEEVLALINSEQSGKWIIPIGGSFSLSSPVSLKGEALDIWITNSDSSESRISLRSLTIERGVSLTIEGKVALEGQDSGDHLVKINRDGSFTLEAGAAVRGNTGGGVQVYGTYTMNGGEISGNTASWGGGVRVASNGTFSMNGGKISDNTAASTGGGVHMASNGTFTMSGGTISGNTAASFGGGVEMGGTFSMSGGTISGNSAPFGGGVRADGTFTMNNGAISGNSATSSSGGGVDVWGIFSMSGGTISGNSASSFGGGVRVFTEGTFTKQADGIIYGSNASSTLKNTAGSDSYGHAVYVSSGSKKRNSTAGEGVLLDSTKSGSAGGWE
jgi:hypothetical protein